MCYSNCKNENRDGDCRGGRIDKYCHCWDEETDNRVWEKEEPEDETNA